jgi:outer membrane protein
MNFWKTLNVISLLGIIALFVLHFQTGKKEAVSDKPLPPSASSNAIVFVNSDTLRAHYTLVKEMNASLEAEYATREGDIKSRQSRYEKDAAYFQQQVQAGSLTEQSAQMIYEELMKNQQDLMSLRDRYTEEIAEKEYRMNERFVDSVYLFLERYNQEFGYDYILGYSRGSGILNAKDTLDITWDVIRKMNEEYQRNNP